MLAGIADALADFADDFTVKAGRSRAGCREADGLNALIDTQVIRFFVLLAQSVRAVADHGRRNAEAFHGLGVPEIGAGEKGTLFFQCHFSNQFFDIHTHPPHHVSLSTACDL